MDELKELKERLSQERPAQWRDLPDIGLYMDQVVSYMPRAAHLLCRERCSHPGHGQQLHQGRTATRADGKNTAALTWPISPPSVPLSGCSPSGRPRPCSTPPPRGRRTGPCTPKFWARWIWPWERTADALDPDTPREELAGLALSLALRSYADQLACQRILDLIAPQEATKAERKRRSKRGRPISKAQMFFL